MTIQEKNIEIAKMLGWKYVSSIDVKDKIYHQSIKAGWYSKLPKALHYKINGLLYKGRSHNDLKFHSDANWQFEAKNHIEKLNYQTYLIYYPNTKLYVVDIWDNSLKIPECLINYSNFSQKDAIFEALFQFSQYIKNK